MSIWWEKLWPELLNLPKFFFLANVSLFTVHIQVDDYEIYVLDFYMLVQYLHKNVPMLVWCMKLWSTFVIHHILPPAVGVYYHNYILQCFILLSYIFINILQNKFLLILIKIPSNFCMYNWNITIYNILNKMLDTFVLASDPVKECTFMWL